MAETPVRQNFPKQPLVNRAITPNDSCQDRPRTHARGHHRNYVSSLRMSAEEHKPAVSDSDHRAKIERLHSATHCGEKITMRCLAHDADTAPICCITPSGRAARGSHVLRQESLQWMASAGLRPAKDQPLRLLALPDDYSLHQFTVGLLRRRKRAFNVVHIPSVVAGLQSALAAGPEGSASMIRAGAARGTAGRAACLAGLAARQLFTCCRRAPPKTSSSRVGPSSSSEPQARASSRRALSRNSVGRTLVCFLKKRPK